MVLLCRESAVWDCHDVFYFNICWQKLNSLKAFTHFFFFNLVSVVLGLWSTLVLCGDRRSTQYHVFGSRRWRQLPSCTCYGVGTSSSILIYRSGLQLSSATLPTSRGSLFSPETFKLWLLNDKHDNSNFNHEVCNVWAFICMVKYFLV